MSGMTSGASVVVSFKLNAILVPFCTGLGDRSAMESVMMLVTQLALGRFGDVLVPFGAFVGYLWPNGLASVTGTAYTGELLVGR